MTESACFVGWTEWMLCKQSSRGLVVSLRVTIRAWCLVKREHLNLHGQASLVGETLHSEGDS